MTREELRKLEEERLNYSWGLSAKEFFIETVLEETSYALGGYENSISDNGKTLEEANMDFFENMQDAINTIHRNIRHALDERLYGARFKGNKAIDEIIVASIKYNLDAKLVDMNGNDIKDIETLDGLEYNQIKFDFRDCWALS